MKKYAIKEVFPTLQGEGAQAGSPAVFLRFAGCNLGYAVCPWCDTDWARAEHTLDADDTLELVRQRAAAGFGAERQGLLLVVTGGEPSLQWDAALAERARARGYRVSMESNGSRPVDRALVDWLTVSPKQPEFVQREGSELKLLFTGSHTEGITPDVAAVRRIAHGTRFEHYYLQPIDLPERGGPNYQEAIRAVMELGPPWRLSVQTHKVTGIP
ncbi:MAG: 7-carboxy-7-deazaguanine synthase QueE [Gemmatimonadota bacterium]|jgi:organic radical activating enzyme|nr:7-carboxy-7-deazaguanine synthase QueE [Gemmatimonadota bacterium]